MARTEQGLSRGNTLCFVSGGGWLDEEDVSEQYWPRCFRKTFDVLMAVGSNVTGFQNVTTCFMSSSYCRKVGTCVFTYSREREKGRERERDFRESVCN